MCGLVQTIDKHDEHKRQPTHVVAGGRCHVSIGNSHGLWRSSCYVQRFFKVLNVIRFSTYFLDDDKNVMSRKHTYIHTYIQFVVHRVQVYWCPFSLTPTLGRLIACVFRNSVNPKCLLVGHFAMILKAFMLIIALWAFLFHIQRLNTNELYGCLKHVGRKYPKSLSCPSISSSYNTTRFMW
jgi:hypothetical protein